MSREESHAIVLGASMGGLLAARALSDHFDRVTIIERDALPLDASPTGAAHRKGVPQGRHAHGILASGRLTLEEMFPGLSATLRAAGAQEADLTGTRWILGGHRQRLDDLGFPGLCCTRPTLEAAVRARVLALPGVSARTEHDVLGLVHRRGRVEGVRVLGRRDGSAEETLAGDLVVDATGRGSKLPQWLEAMGYSPPAEERVRVKISYTTALFRRERRHVDGGIVLVVGAAPPNPRAGVALAVGPDTWIVTLIGYLGERAEPSHEGCLAFSRTLPAPDLHQLLEDSEPVSEFSTSTFSHSQRRRYDALDEHPEGLIAFGDAMCSFNPIFGQGMTVAAHEARALGACLAGGETAGLWRRFYKSSRAIIDIPWSIAVGNDLRYPDVEGARPALGGLLDRYLDRVLAVGASDARVGTAFLRVTNLLDPPQALMRPTTLARVLLGTPARSTLATPAEGDAALATRG